MSGKYWIKLYHEILHDKKVARLDDHIWRRVIECFLMAGENNDGGYLPSLDDMTWILRDQHEQIETDLNELVKVGILQIIDGRYLVRKFTERQAALPKAEYMSRKRKSETGEKYYQNDTESLPDSYQPVTNGNRDTDTDIDINAAKAAPAIDPPASKKELSDKQKALKARRDAMVKHFLMRTGLPAPRGDVKVVQKMWWSPLDEIYTLAGENMDAASKLVDKTLARMGKLTISDPNSIIKTARAVYAENNGGKVAPVTADQYYDGWELH